MSKPALAALLIGLGTLWIVVSNASRPTVALALVLSFMLYWVFRQK